jgi:hypothetical protein
MLFRMNLRRTVTAHIARFIPTQTRPQGADEQDKTPQELYESIAIGNALAEIEDTASRQWRGQ